MKILVAEDDESVAMMLKASLALWGYDVSCYFEGPPALESLRGNGGPQIAILDWQLPGMTGLEVCKEVRKSSQTVPVYIIVLTGKSEKGAIVEALEAGANDYVTKPFHPDELRARVLVGRRTLELERSLAQRVHELEEARQENAELQSIVPICSYCKKIRDDDQYWEQLETYLLHKKGVLFSHSICPECYDAQMKRLMGPGSEP